MTRKYPDLIGDLAVIQGETYRQLTHILPGDKTTWTARGQIRINLLADDVGDPVAVFEWESPTYDAGNDETTFFPYLSAAVTANLPRTKYQGDVTQLRVKKAYVYDLEFESPAGEVEKLAPGFLQAIGEVTDESIVWNPPIFWDGSVDHVSLTSTNGLIKTYTLWGDAAETLNLGTFTVEDGNGIASTAYNTGTGILTITYEDATTFSTGDIRGAQGVKGDKGDKGDIGNTGLTGNGISSTAYNAGTGVLTLTFSDATTYSTGDIRGAQGIQGIQGLKGDTGSAGNGIASTEYNFVTGILTLFFTAGGSYSTGDIRGAQGVKGDKGDTGDKGDQGIQGEPGTLDAAEIKTRYESNANTNAFTDAEQTKLTGLNSANYATSAQGSLADTALQPAAITNFETTTQLNARDTANRDRVNHTGSQAIATVTGLQTALDSKEPADGTILKDADIGVTVQGYTAILAGTTASFTTADETKLDGIETAATADQTGGEIKTLYEANVDTNAFTDAEQAKLTGIATGAQVNVPTDLTYTAASRLLASSTGADATLPEVIAAGTSGLMTGADKTKLDGIAAGAEVNVQSDWTAGSGDAHILNKPTLAAVATSGAYTDLSGLPTLGTAAATASTDYATAAQGTTADTAVQPAGIANFETTTQLNARDTNDRARVNHTGTQLAATISDFTAASQAVIDNTAFVFEGGDSSTNFYAITLEMGQSA